MADLRKTSRPGGFLVEKKLTSDRLSTMDIIIRTRFRMVPSLTWPLVLRNIPTMLRMRSGLIRRGIG